MALDIRRDMLVMWIRAGQVGNVRMLEGIIPTDFLIRAVDFVTVVDNPLTIRIHQLPDIKQHVSGRESPGLPVWPEQDLWSPILVWSVERRHIVLAASR